MENRNLAGRARHAMNQCGADSITVFVFGGADGASQVTYVHTLGVPDDVNEIYQRSIFRHDPFLAARRSLCDRSAAAPLVIDRARAESLCDAADLKPYQSFMQRFGYCESIAAVREVTPDTVIVAGLLKQGRSRGRRVLAAATAGETLHHLLDEVAADVVQSALRLYHRESAATTPGCRDLGLTARENDVAGLLCSGHSNKQIANRLGLSGFTVENNLRRIYRKFNVHNRTSLMAAVAASHHLRTAA